MADLKRNNRALKKRTWSAARWTRAQRRFDKRYKASHSVDIVASLVVPTQIFVRVWVPGRLLAKSKLRRQVRRG